MELELGSEGFWNDAGHAREVSQEAARLRQAVDGYQRLSSDLEGLDELWNELDEHERDQLEPDIEALKSELRVLYHSTLLANPYSDKNAVMRITPGAGGTEACDWAEMLLRMYLHFVEHMGFSVDLVEITPGAEAGIDSAELIVRGENAYGLLSAEGGVHRLVRPSPFDSSGRRHTSFAALEVMPEVDDSVNLVIRPEDLRFDVFRAQGHGGQGVNTTDSAVRVVHIPTGMIVTSQVTRSQHKNKEMAMRVLRARLFKIEWDKKQQELAKRRGDARPIEWGSQIRSYVLDKQYIKDHRSGLMRHDTQNVLDGDIEDFVWAGLEWKVGRRVNSSPDAET